GPRRLQGQIEAREYSISSKLPGRIARVLVHRGDPVTAGQTIFTLRSPEIEAKLQQAEAGKAAAGALYRQAENGARPQQVQAAREQWLKAKAAADLMEKTYVRIESLYDDGVLPEQKRDEVYTKWQAALHTEQAARAVYEMAEEGARREIKDAAKAKENMAAAMVKEVEAYADETTVTTYHDGEVSQVLLRAGELAPRGFPVVTVVDMHDAWVVLQVREDLLQRFAKGHEFEARIPALGGGPYRFKVTYLSVMGDFATWRPTDTSTGFDMRTFEIEARPVKPIEGLRVGMSVLVDL
ncbi:MAG TPA: biotin/lipoyl-binding protein, partial [Acidobacteria bacterium]|nr:biotin/lipoyl-binding protein [Acidobacteriota bacterium]